KIHLRKLDPRIAAAAKYIFESRFAPHQEVYENLDLIGRDEFDGMIEQALKAADGEEKVAFNTPWEGHCINEAHKFASKCSELRNINPYSEPALERIMNDLMTELWDRGFSQTEIKTAMEKAVADMPRYAAGENRRGDKK